MTRAAAPRVLRAPTVLTRDLPGEVHLATATGGDVHVLTGTARAVWHVLDQPRAVAAVVADLARTFGVAEADIAIAAVICVPSAFTTGCVPKASP